jgi:hypothetical protein
MAGFIEGVDRGQSALFPDRLDDWIGEDRADDLSGVGPLCCFCAQGNQVDCQNGQVTLV